jgi:hypothetical protein
MQTSQNAKQNEKAFSLKNHPFLNLTPKRKLGFYIQINLI